jgi:catechol 2,3-dioxygenase-like lactoylglutathione lyase family enzyme
MGLAAIDFIVSLHAGQSRCGAIYRVSERFPNAGIRMMIEGHGSSSRQRITASTETAVPYRVDGKSGRVDEGKYPMRMDFLAANLILYCRRWDAMVRFYRDRLLLPVIFSTDWFVEFRLTDESRLSIADEARASVKSKGNGGVTLALQVADIEAAREHAETMGLEPTAIRKHPWDARLFYVFDPEGHRIEIWQFVAGDVALEPAPD